MCIRDSASRAKTRLPLIASEGALLSVFYLLLGDAVGAGVPAGASGITIIVAGIVPVVTAGIVAGVAISAGSGAGIIRALGGIARIGEALLGELLSLSLIHI